MNKNSTAKTVLVVGASGATGRLLVAELLACGHTVRAIVRALDSVPPALAAHAQLELIEAALLDLSDTELRKIVQNCDAVASCLGHNMTWKGVFGAPRGLVTEATRRLCDAIQSEHPDGHVKFVLMNTTGNRNRDLTEPISLRHRCVVGLLRVLLPPHRDNEAASDVLRVQIGQQNPQLEWCVVRPDTLIDHDVITAYQAVASPLRCPIFDAGKTSRINVAAFMAQLITDADVWSTWKGQMPVVYNLETE